MRARVALPLLPLLGAGLLALALPAEAGRRRAPDHEPEGHQTYASPQSQPIALSPDGQSLYVAATTSDAVEVIDATTDTFVERVPVGMEPVGLAVRPDGLEVWVANHVSDSVSVIDTDPTSASYLEVVETVQDFDSRGVTRFDEPVGVAFAEDGSKAYVTLSSRNDVAVVSAQGQNAYQVTNRLHVTAQEPRALAVRNGRLYVAAFESGNRSEVSACESLDQDPSCTMEASDLVSFAFNPNLPNEVKNIEVEPLGPGGGPEFPDRDLFVYDTSNDQLVDVVDSVGTLLYGLAVSSSDEVFVAQTEARNADNGGNEENLVDLENRMFLNQIARVDCSGGSCASPSRIELEPLPSDGSPNPPAAGAALATPYGIAVSGDGSTVVATAAASSRIFTLDPATGSVLGRLDVGPIPRGVALRSDTQGAPDTAYVLNTLGNYVSVVDVSDPTQPVSTKILAVSQDPTPAAIRRGRIAFNSAQASTSGTFACASCHPDGNTDQLLWRIGGQCANCVADEPRSTMPIRGLRDTLPLHWDGTLGDPFGGANGASGGEDVGTNCSRSNPHSCFRQLVDASQAAVMCVQPSCPTGPSGQPGPLTDAERDDMATFLAAVSYPPARSRRPDDRLSTDADGITRTLQDSNQNPVVETVSAEQGLRDFFRNQGSQLGVTNPNTCADSRAGCHELPLGTATNSETLQDFDAPTMRGMTDRFLQFSLGITATTELLAGSNDGFTASPFTAPPNPIPWDPAEGFEEDGVFGVAFGVFTPVYNVGPADLFQLFEETSTGHAGVLGRQVTLNTRTTNGSAASGTGALLDALEDADQRGLVNVRGTVVRSGVTEKISYLAASDLYRVGSAEIPRSTVVSEAQTGTLRGTLTAHLRSGVSEDTPQPLVAPPGANCNSTPIGNFTSDDPALPLLPGSTTVLDVEAKHVSAQTRVVVDGAPVPGASVTIFAANPLCGSEAFVSTPMEIDLGTQPSAGIHALQLQTPKGLLSNEMPFVVEP